MTCWKNCIHVLELSLLRARSLSPVGMTFKLKVEVADLEAGVIGCLSSGSRATENAGRRGLPNIALCRLLNPVPDLILSQF